MSSLITSDGCSLIYDKGRNLIEISLPQTMRTVANMIDTPVNRKTDISDEEAILLLSIVKRIFGISG